MDNTKTVWQSKTFWVNVLTLAASVLTMVVSNELLLAYPVILKALVTILAVVNIGLRLVTNAPVTVTAPKAPPASLWLLAAVLLFGSMGCNGSPACPGPACDDRSCPSDGCRVGYRQEDPIAGLECPDPRLAVDLPADVRRWYRNPDGSCVQCSIGMCGVDQNVPAAATLLWDTEYGPKERGGSYPSRVANYARKRGIKIYNVTGSETFAWMKWACATGRGAAIGAGRAHFQTLMGYDPRAGKWYVCNNNSTHKIDEYSEEGFRKLHLASGPWVVILDYPPHPERAQYVRWW